MKAEWHGKTKGRNWGQRFLFSFLRRFSCRLLYPFLHVVVPFYILFNPIDARSSYRFYRRMMHFGKLKSLRYMRRNFKTFGRVIIDKFALWAGNTAQFDVHFDNQDLFTQLTLGEKGFIVASAHIGNFEMAATTMQHCRKPINIIFWGNESDLITKQRLDSFNKEDFHVNIIHIRDGLSYIFEIKEALSKGEIIITNCDRFAEGQRRTKARFFDTEACFPTGIFHIAVTLGVPMLFISTMKGQGNSYIGNVAPLATPDTGTNAEKTQALVQTDATLLESQVRQKPLQWFNFYDFAKI